MDLYEKPQAEYIDFAIEEIMNVGVDGEIDSLTPGQGHKPGL